MHRCTYLFTWIISYKRQEIIIQLHKICIYIEMHQVDGQGVEEMGPKVKENHREKNGRDLMCSSKQIKPD